jgi:hypothetical protein
MGYVNKNNEIITFLDMEGKEILIGDHIYPPEGGRELRVALFQSDFYEFGDVLVCQQVEDLDAFSPLTVEDCRLKWKKIQKQEN